MLALDNCEGTEYLNVETVELGGLNFEGKPPMHYLCMYGQQPNVARMSMAWLAFYVARYE